MAYRSGVDEGRLPRAMGTTVLALLLASVAFFGTTFVAEADPWGDMTNESNGIGTHPDSDPHTYCYTSSVPSGLRTNIENAMWNAMDESVMIPVTRIRLPSSKPAIVLTPSKRKFG